MYKNATTFLGLALLLSPGCEQVPDVDGDGFDSSQDCDDESDAVGPGVPEICNGVDDNCDGFVDLGATDAATFYADLDGDGYGDPSSSELACAAPEGMVSDASDCDDGDAAVSPDGLEICNGRDDDCDGDFDEGAVGEGTWYADRDGDGAGDPASSDPSCEPPAGYVANADDCDDEDAGAAPGRPELCDGIDNDCDGSVDEDAVDAGTYYADADLDGFGDAAAPLQACAPPPGSVDDATDCDDLAASVHPGADESCNGVDDDCDGLIDEDPVNGGTWYLDADGDGVAGSETSVLACAAPAGFYALAADCDDATAAIHPAAMEICDGVDNDCDGGVDLDATDLLTWYADDDGDLYGAPGAPIDACTQPAGYVSNALDCDDLASTSHPGALETCDGADNDCDGLTDNDALDVATWYLDQDGDGFGDPDNDLVACAPPADHVADHSDCDDNASGVYPGADEICNSLDDDCDGEVDENPVDANTYFLDYDGDSYGSSAITIEACAIPDGYSASSLDCDDGSALSYPGADEFCDLQDNDCDGDVDEGALDEGSWYDDLDGDLYGDPAAPVSACLQPAGAVLNDGDCDDSRAGSHPGAVEICDGLDNSCSGAIDDGAIDEPTWYEDSDGDGYGWNGSSQRACDDPGAGWESNAGDCNDQNGAQNPGAAEVCDGQDNDCDGVTDGASALDATTWYIDGDGDGFGDPSVPLSACSQPAGFVTDSSDCHDDEPLAYPGSHEIETPLDGIDTDCDGADWCSDLDCDGRVDLVLFDHYDGDYFAPSFVYYNNGAGFSDSNRDTVSTVGTYDTAVEDLDFDGYKDIVAANYYNGTTRAVNSAIFWGSASGYSDSDRTDLPTVGGVRVLIEDLDADGFFDIVFANYYDDSAYDIDSFVYWGSAAGYSAGNRTGLPTQGGWRIDSADFDSDGFTDLLFCNHHGDSSSWDVDSYIYYGSASGYLVGNRVGLPTSGCYDQLVEDLDGDGYLDIAFANYRSGANNFNISSYVYWGSAAGFSTADRSDLPVMGALRVASGDLDGNGRPDLIFGGYYGGSWPATAQTQVYYGTATGYSVGNRSSLGTKGVRGLQVQDLDGDGFDDVVASRYYNGSSYNTDSYVYWGSGAGLSDSDRTDLPTSGASKAAVGDIDGDGIPELIFNNYHSGNWSTPAPSTIYFGQSVAPQYVSSNQSSLATHGTWSFPLLVGPTP